MPSEQDHRAAILVALLSGPRAQRNYRVPKTTVYRVAQYLNESKGNVHPRRRFKTGPEAKKKRLQSFSTSSREDQQRSRHLYEGPGHQMNVDEKTIRTAVYEDPRSKTYVLRSDKCCLRSQRPNCLSDNLPMFWSKEIWPPSSPDCNPLN
ncbi:Uncharacterized protein FKW44_021746 [Caligus rogercresseyi]|uniref:Uncharacterized protein n=1 Tax=Caligus rogercresseyi TaxID=217165 RepID=A0A7T8JVC8_CALRO|nr:Uncharacterized protein FKW44_021746 [Caligus rogercresseyi]